MEHTRSRRELTVQICQAFLHAIMAMVTAYGMPQSYLDDPVHSICVKDHHSIQPEPWGVRVAYFLSATYHGVLYFWDPMSTTTLRAHHIATVMLGTVLMVYGELGWVMLVMMANYLFDSVEFVQHRLKELHPNRVVIASMIKIHHMVTIMLLGVSWIYSFTAFGMIILFIHDVTDVPMFVVRILRRPGVALSTRVSLLAVAVVMTWMYFRVYWMGFYIVDGYTRRHQCPLNLVTPVWTALGGMVVLWCFNVYWTALVVYKVVREGLMGDKSSLHHE